MTDTLDKKGTLDTTKPIDQTDVTNLVSDLALKSPLASPIFTGVVTTPAVTLTSNQVLNHTVATITASTTQNQGEGVLTGTFNQVSIVEFNNDVVTLPTAVKGLEVEIANDGANTLQIFPASGDDLGNGVNLSTQLETNESIKFFAFDTTNWDIEADTEIFHAEIHDENNTDLFVINDVGTDEHAYHTNGLVSGDLAGWTFDTGGAGTSHAITVIANAGGGNITVTTGDAHGLAVGDIVTHTNLADTAYVGFFKVLTETTTTYTVTAAFTATGTGTMDQAATLDVNDIAVGTYSIQWHASVTTVGNNETIDFGIHKNTTHINGSRARHKFGTGADFGLVGGQAITNVVSGDKILFHVANQDSVGNITIRNFSLMLIRL